jgi:hypothetical protein
VTEPVAVLQASVVQRLPSLNPGQLQPGICVCVIEPLAVLQASVVQGLMSSMLTGIWVMVPVTELQASVVQALPSLTFGPV